MTRPAYSPTVVKKIRALGQTVIVSNMVFDQRITSGGIILPNDDMKNTGIRPRWAQVYAIGPEQQDVSVGQWVLIAHGRWTRGVKIVDDVAERTIRKVDPNDILMVSDEPVNDDTLSDKEV